MKRLFLMMAMLAFMVSAQTVMAGDPSYLGLWKEWKAEQAQQATISANLAKIDKGIVRDFGGATMQAGRRVLPWGTAAGQGSGY